MNKPVQRVYHPKASTSPFRNQNRSNDSTKNPSTNHPWSRRETRLQKWLLKPHTARKILLIDSGLVGRGATRAEDAQGTPTQSHISPSILVYKDKRAPLLRRHYQFSALDGQSLGRLGGNQPTHRNVQRFRGGLAFKAHRLLYHSTLGLRVIKKKKKNQSTPRRKHVSGSSLSLSRRLFG